MNTTRAALAALLVAGLLWGTTVPLSKLALEGLGPGWLTVVRFALAAPVLVLLARRTLRAAASPAVLAAGALGYGGVIVLQSAGIERTSVSHAALLVGALPVLVALLAAVLGRGAAGPVAWSGFLVALAGIALVTGGEDGTATLVGDALVLASVVVSAGFLVAQPRLLQGRDPMAVTGVQFLGATLAALPVAYAWEGSPTVPSSPAVLLATLGLVLAGTLVPFALYAYGQAHVAPETAGAFLNLEPLVGVALGALAFGEPLGPGQLVGGAAVLVGIALGAAPGRSVPDRAVDPLPDQVGVPVVPRVLLDHVDVDPAQRERLPAAGPRGQRVQVVHRRGGVPAPRHLGAVAGEVGRRVGVVDVVEVPVRVGVGVVQRLGVPAGQVPEEPVALHLGHVPDQPEQAQRGGLDGTALQLLPVEARALAEQGGAVEVEPGVEHAALVGDVRRVGAVAERRELRLDGGVRGGRLGHGGRGRGGRGRGGRGRGGRGRGGRGRGGWGRGGRGGGGSRLGWRLRHAREP